MATLPELQDLQVTAGDQVDLAVTTDTAAVDAVCSIVNSNLNVVTELTSVLDGAGTGLTITLTDEVTLAARSTKTILEIAWNYGGSVVKNTRVNLVGVD